MYPDLSYILHDLFGTQPDNWASIIKTFGLLLAISILVSAWILYLELKRKKNEGLFKPVRTKVVEGAPATLNEIIINAIFGFIIGFKTLYVLQFFEEFKADASDVILSAKGDWLGGIIGALIFGGLKYWEKNRKKLPKPKEKIVEIYPHDRIGDITIIAAISGVIGAKIFAIIEDIDTFLQDPLGTFFSGSGMAIYGGLIVGFLVTYFYLKRKNIPPIHVLDAVAPALIIGYGIGRLGCHFSGDGDWGLVNAAAQPSWWFLPDWLWAYDYPHNVIDEGVSIEGCNWLHCKRLEPPVYPTPLYETIMAFLIGAFLWIIRKRVRIAGMLFFIYVFLNGVERFLIESIRVNKHYDFLSLRLTQAEFIAIALMIIGIAGGYWVWRKHQRKPKVV